MDTKQIQKIVRKYSEQWYANKLDKLDEMDKFLETYNLPKYNQKESENLNRQITPSEIKAIIKTKQQNPPNKQKSWMKSFQRCILPKKNFGNTYSQMFPKNFKKSEVSQTHFTWPA